jgi:hypothetical protein
LRREGSIDAAQTCARVGFGGHSSTSECSKVRKQRLLDDPRLSRLKLSSDTLGGGASETRKVPTKDAEH